MLCAFHLNVKQNKTKTNVLIPQPISLAGSPATHQARESPPATRISLPHFWAAELFFKSYFTPQLPTPTDSSLAEFPEVKPRTHSSYLTEAFLNT